MKIVAVEPILLEIPMTIGGAPPPSGGKPWSALNILLVKVETDEGIIGWGEAFGHNACAMTKAALETMIAPLCLGRDATQIEPLGRELQQQLHIVGRGGGVL